jgi:hypothetical protein
VEIWLKSFDEKYFIGKIVLNLRNLFCRKAILSIFIQLQKVIKSILKRIKPVSPNCHVMLHKRVNGELITIDELKKKFRDLLHHPERFKFTRG